MAEQEHFKLIYTCQKPLTSFTFQKKKKLQSLRQKYLIAKQILAELKGESQVRALSPSSPSTTYCKVKRNCSDRLSRTKRISLQITAMKKAGLQCTVFLSPFTKHITPFI